MSFKDQCFFWPAGKKNLIKAEFITRDGKVVHGFGEDHDEAAEDCLFNLPGKEAKRFLRD